MKTKFISLLLITLLITACNPCKRLTRLCPPMIKDSIIYTETITENPNYTIPDSAYWDLQFECDSNFNVVLKQLNEANSGLRTETILVYKEDETKKKILFVSLKAQSDSILTLNKTIEKLRNEKHTEIAYQDKEVIVYKSRKMFVWSFVILIILAILGAVVIYFRIKNKTLKSLLNR